MTALVHLSTTVAWSLFKRRPEAAPAPAQANTLAGRYRLGLQLGDGATATVYEAVDMRTGAIVAAKLAPLPSDLPVQQRADWLARTQREVNVARRLEHPDILAVLDAGLNDTHAWMITERVHGHDLSRYIRPSRLLPESLVLQIGARLAVALAHAHSRGVVHRDVKPGNVLLDLAAGAVKLADFGTARADDPLVTRTGVMIGTPAYMAPELLSGNPAEPATDAYALGAVVFELLAGRRLHEADTLGDLLRSMANSVPSRLAALRPDLPPSVIALVEQLLPADPARRRPDLTGWALDAGRLANAIERAQAPSRRATA